MSSQVSLILLNLIFDEVVRHQSQCSIFAIINSLRYLTFSSVRAVFSRPQRRYLAFVLLLTHAHQPVYRLLSLSKVQPFSKNCATIVICSVSKTKFPQCLDPSFIFVRYFIHKKIKGLTAIMA